MIQKYNVLTHMQLGCLDYELLWNLANITTLHYYTTLILINIQVSLTRKYIKDFNLNHSWTVYEILY